MELIGQTGLINADFWWVRGLAYDSNQGVLYGTTNTGTLSTINTETGAGTVVGETDEDWSVRALAFDPGTNTLYGLSVTQAINDNWSYRLFAISTTTANTTLVGEQTCSACWFEGLAYDSVSEQLFASEMVSNRLMVINKVSAVATRVGDMGFASVRDLASGAN